MHGILLPCILFFKKSNYFFDFEELFLPVDFLTADLVAFLTLDLAAAAAFFLAAGTKIKMRIIMTRITAAAMTPYSIGGVNNLSMMVGSGCWTVMGML